MNYRTINKIAHEIPTNKRLYFMVYCQALLDCLNSRDSRNSPKQSKAIRKELDYWIHNIHYGTISQMDIALAMGWDVLGMQKMLIVEYERHNGKQEAPKT